MLKAPFFAYYFPNLFPKSFSIYPQILVSCHIHPTCKVTRQVSHIYYMSLLDVVVTAFIVLHISWPIFLLAFDFRD